MRNIFSFIFPQHFGKKLMVASIFVILMLTFLPTMLIYSSNIFLALGFGIFYFMMFEDYYEHTIDMGLVCLLLLCFVLSNGFRQAINFILIYISCLAGIQSLRAFTAHEIPETLSDIQTIETKIEASDLKDETVTPYGWLPSFGISVLVVSFFAFILQNHHIPLLTEAGYGFDMFMILILPQSYLDIVLLIFLLCVVWCYLNYRNQQKENEGKELAYGFGDGDGYIFAGFIALFGIKTFLVILFFNMILLLLIGLPNYLKQKNRECI